MKVDLALKPTEFTSSFLSCEKDMQLILKKLFVQSQPYSNDLKRLLIINTKDCLSNKTSQIYNNAIKDASLAWLKDNGYIRYQPLLKMKEHQELKNYLIFSFDNFTPNRTNPQFRDRYIMIDVLCHSQCWELGNFNLRPLKICGYIDGILNNARLSGIGTFQFLGCNRITLDENWSGYTLIYYSIHGTDDVLPSQHDWIKK